MLKTWDIFDTLIARRCIYPQTIFELVEKVSKTKGFVQARIIAERNVLMRGNCNLDSIYEEFGAITNAPKNICDIFKKLECDIEYEQSIPITENILQVKAGDILISDMYLPEKVIRRLLAKAGLLAPVEIVITSGGKYSGLVWKQLAAQKKNIFHIGDNEFSDLANPRNFNLDSSLYVRNRPNIVEQFLMNHDFEFAAYLREIRLRNPFSEEVKRLYWEFFTLNIAILIIIVRQLDELQKKHGFEYLGFCGRDTYYLKMLYERYKYDIGEEPVANDYLFYSRKMLNSSRAETIRYFQEKIKNRKALLLDLIGTGSTLHKLRCGGGIALNYSLLICCHLGKLFAETYNKPGGIPDKFISFMDNPNAPEEKNSAFYFAGYEEGERYIGPGNELFNRATHMSPIRLNLVQIGNKILPEVLFSQVNDTENLDVFESCLHEVLKSKIVWSKLRRKDILEQLLKIFGVWAAPRIFRGQQTLEDQMGGLAAQAQRK